MCTVYGRYAYLLHVTTEPFIELACQGFDAMWGFCSCGAIAWHMNWADMQTLWGSLCIQLYIWGPVQNELHAGQYVCGHVVLELRWCMCTDHLHGGESD
jgi:hypothetical protein